EEERCASAAFVGAAMSGRLPLAELRRYSAKWKLIRQEIRRLGKTLCLVLIERGGAQQPPHEDDEDELTDRPPVPTGEWCLDRPRQQARWDSSVKLKPRSFPCPPRRTGRSGRPRTGWRRRRKRTVPCRVGSRPWSWSWSWSGAAPLAS